MYSDINFDDFVKTIENIYNETKEIRDGDVASYIPQLAKVNSDLFGISICSVNGDRKDFGNHKFPFCLQSCSKPITYCIARETNKDLRVHDYIGHEPSGQKFNSFTLNDGRKPHNPMINAGAIMTCSLIKPDENEANRFDFVQEYFRKMMNGNCYLGFDNSVYLSEKSTADRNFALAYFMNENKGFPEHTNIKKTLELYFQICSITSNTESLCILAGTLANGGVCPLTGERIFSEEVVRDCLCLMYSCGMYDYSGRFAFEIGLPAKSGVSGVLLLIIPGFAGICMFSPRLEKSGNSVRGLEVCKRIIEKYPFHLFHTCFSNEFNTDNPELNSYLFIKAASEKDIKKIEELISKVNINSKDYDKRTALHLAAAEGSTDIVKLLIEKGVDKTSEDRWGNTALSEAIKIKNQEIIDLLK